MIQIRTVQPDDVVEIAAIYNTYIVDSIITFETEKVTATDILQRIQKVTQLYDWLVLIENGMLVGYAYYTSFRERKAYEHTVESTIYLKSGSSGKGMGSDLYTALLERIKNKGFREVMGVIALPNPESTRFHEKLGFKNMGVLKNVGFKFDTYLDVAFYQKTLRID
ncbi:MAG: N-acetyltransferase [Flavobacteriaceae bacterium]|nr:N-acetyltransferase [Flavobacteriaceae bacterium]